MKSSITLEQFMKEILTTAEKRAMFLERAFVLRVASQIEQTRQDRDISLRKLAEMSGVSTSQLQRILGEEISGSVTLRTLFRVIAALDLKIEHPLLTSSGFEKDSCSKGKSISLDLDCASFDPSITSNDYELEGVV